MKKLLLLFTASLTPFLLMACEGEPSESYDEDFTLNIYYLPDLHGALLEEDGDMGMARIGNLLIDEKETNPESTLIFGGGDMLQGALISNRDYGETTTKIMDEVGFDATVVGNHEFDWGLENVTRYYTESDAYQADHSFLAANIFYEGTEEIPEGIEPYDTFERNGLTIGVVGAVGYGQESSIIPEMVEDYTFEDPVPYVQDHAQTLRNDYDADLVMFLSHDGMDTVVDTNQRLGSGEGDEAIDAIFYAHTHWTDAGYVEGTPAIISGSSGSHVGLMSLDIEAGDIVETRMNNLGPTDDNRLMFPDSNVQSIIEDHKASMSEYFEESLTSDDAYSQGNLTEWIARLMKRSTGADIGIQNNGGTRDNFSSGAEITPSRLYDVFPFDNTIATSDVSGAEALDLIDNNGYAANITVSDIDPNETYTVATNSYVFQSSYNELDNGDNITESGSTLFDLALEKFNTLDSEGDTFRLRDDPSIGLLPEWE